MSGYGYASANPLNAVDPTGLIAYICKKGINIGIAFPIYFEGGPADSVARQKLIDGMIQDVEDGWTGQWDQFNVKLNAYQVPFPNSAVNTVKIRMDGVASQSGGKYGFWAAPPRWKYNEYAHEAGHMMGLISDTNEANSMMGRNLYGASPTISELQGILDSDRDGPVGGDNVICDCQ